MILDSLTDVGVKRKDNQDNYWSARLDVNGEEAGVICLCDGMGGLHNGGLASKIVVEAVKEYFLESIDFEGLKARLKEVNSEVVGMGSTCEGALGTTCTVLLCFRGRYHILHIGDSRCYRYSGGKLYKLTEDHTVVEKYRKQGKILPDHLMKKYKNALTRCIGVSNTIHIDYVAGDYQDGDIFLVCSDGFWHNLGVSHFANNDISDLDRLIKKFIAKGETDNITVGVLRI